MNLQLLPATDQHLSFARDLTRRAMLPYFNRHDLLWQDKGFDEAWPSRDNRLLCDAGQVLGYLSLMVHSNALYLLELHLLEQYRGMGVGGWALVQVQAIARHAGVPRVRLTVFKGNPALTLYQRHGFVVLGDNESYLLMELHLGHPGGALQMPL